MAEEATAAGWRLHLGEGEGDGVGSDGGNGTVPVGMTSAAATATADVWAVVIGLWVCGVVGMHAPS